MELFLLASSMSQVVGPPGERGAEIGGLAEITHFAIGLFTRRMMDATIDSRGKALIFFGFSLRE